MSSRFVSFAKAVRNNPKKSVVFAGLGAFIVRYVVRREQRKELIRDYAKVAAAFGAEGISAEWRPRRVTVLVNGWAREAGAKSDFEETALPLFHLAGLQVTVIRPKSADELQQLAAVLGKEEADLVYVVGGDGTLARVITGVMANAERLPLGAFPGGNRSFGLRQLWAAHAETREASGLLPPWAAEWAEFLRSASVKDAEWGCESAMAVIRDQRAPVSVVEVAVGEERHFGLGTLHVGSFRGIDESRYSYWLLGPLRHYFAFLWTTIWAPPMSLETDIKYTEACEGCSKCITGTKPAVGRRWWQVFAKPAPQSQEQRDLDERGRRVNEECGVIKSFSTTTCEVAALNDGRKVGGSVWVGIGPERIGRFAFIAEGWARLFASTGSIIKASCPEQFYTQQLRVRELSLITRQIYSKRQLEETKLSEEELAEEKRDAAIHRASFNERLETGDMDPFVSRETAAGVNGDTVDAAALHFRVLPAAVSFFLPHTFSLPQTS